MQAAWVETAAGQFIQTLEQYGQRRQYNLVAWNAKSAGNIVDAVTGATIPLHRGHTVSWDCIDLSGNVVADGGYQIVLELTEDNSGGFFGPPSQQLIVPFQKGAPADVTVPGTNVYSNVRLVLQ